MCRIWDGISIIDDMIEEVWMDVHGMFNYMMGYSRFLVIGIVWWTYERNMNGKGFKKWKISYVHGRVWKMIGLECGVYEVVV